MLRLFVLAAITAVAVSLAPRNADAQILGRIKQQTTEKLKDKKKAADDKVVGAAGQVVDSVATKSARGVDTVVTRTSNTLNAAVDKTEQTVAGAFKGGGSESALAKQLAAGHVVLADIRFTAEGTLTPASLETIRALARQMKAGTDTWIVEGHVVAGEGDQGLSEQRARVIKGTLVEEGLDMSRIFARGFGSTRPAAGASAPTDRIEIVRMQ